MGQPQSKPRFLQPGDHIYCEREGGLYDHHGIYVGDDMVIHLQGKAKKLEPLPECRKCKDKRVQNGEIAKVCIDCFLRGEKPRIYDYGVPLNEFRFRKRGTCCPHHSKPPHVVISAATYFLEGASFGHYDMFNNNCENFAVYCKTGCADGYQIVGFLEKGSLATAAVAASLGGPPGIVLCAASMAIYGTSKVVTGLNRHN
ncbi:hypothetical protein E1A91_D08G258900v1 [Gossypium mustelinum]|uniref:LRAT domain-containing protein n=4 Tax=Gossypium TaxID=3633 RepID=A0A5J5QJZ3_GOSBA|nr:hypothetical protein ES319_D08G255300v1 [Gossypium barbadense]TYG59006.1 hypothetical protein ES288_D08G267900v1 [Gossypium darwinii]TYH60064.1 hypothetical protein ES332_D08G266800v1 [Gossypium tomentosum]TYI70940.1 hypothetical protein E1A91_D08G258900v1 [Gossypium mustelinum]